MTASMVALLDHVTKEYRLHQERSNVRSLIPGRRGELEGGTLFRALDEVSFGVAAGEAIGIIGHNGAGKSTVLKLLAGIMEPSAGRVSTTGRTASLIELGVGFDPDLTGRENISFAGDLMGLSRAEIRRQFDYIVDFSEMEHFLDMPVKRYSTGMSARLGFSVATAVQTELLIIDEVLSVGDHAFQKKSLERIRDLHTEGAALVLVSHNLWMVSALCQRLILFEHGRIVIDGPAEDVISTYIGPDLVSELDPEVGATFHDYIVTEQGRQAVTIDAIEAEPRCIRPGEPVTVRARITVHRPVDGIVVMSLYTSERAVFAERDPGPVDFLQSPGTWTVEARVASVPLAMGRFQFRFAVLPEDDPHHSQEFPTAFAVASTDVAIDGGVTARPGIKLDTTWVTETTPLLKSGRGGPESEPT